MKTIEKESFNDKSSWHGVGWVSQSVSYDVKLILIAFWGHRTPGIGGTNSSEIRELWKLWGLECIGVYKFSWQCFVLLS